MEVDVQKDVMDVCWFVGADGTIQALMGANKNKGWSAIHWKERETFVNGFQMGDLL